MRIGKLDRRVRIERMGIPVDDGYTSRPAGWLPLAEIWCNVAPVSGREAASSNQTDAFALTKFTIRWSTMVADINPKDRLEYPPGSEAHYDIKSAIEIGRRENIEIIAVRNPDL
jgi:head-tail adaptor